jgi:hypothetical protein
MLLARIFFYGVLILLAGTVLAMLPGDRSALRWRLIVAAVMAGMIGLLSHNFLDVAHWYGRAVLNYVFNDAETHPHTKTFQDQPEWYLTAQRILNQRFGSYAAYGILTYVVAPLLPANYENGLAVYAAYHRDVDGKGWSDVKSGLADISQWSASRKIPVVGVIWPFLADQWQTGSESLHAQVRSAMQDRGFNVVDLGPVFAKQSPHLADFGISAVDSHPNARANQVVASVLLDKVKALRDGK